MGARFSAPVQTGPGAHPASCTMGTGSFPGVKFGRGVTLTPYPLSAVGHERVELYFYTPYGPYGLYRASLPVQGCSLTLPYSSETSAFCNFLHSTVPSSLLGPNFLLSTLFSNTLSIRSSLNVSDQVSHPYRTAGKIVALYDLNL